ncbi:MAG: 23S rRNA (pseudouridine(1915)-N(3))-methyltransferase RlmH [Firmicutes bacterium]|uniref:Ribosomal RNA large subunit methyltransferase H n=1 Tax=Melghirimyces thermohalophilus TaxID=1236220 RepID=A0A1G6M5H2_9BACL|nr:23S rRNA (pseudouridine(1915)-N(3))-methyltransferase RlmH [Melghirimyces thermohalophilus]MDA8351990.1 23S rRNA (pseudouridine(1915)-N(3))-methyltransferase RlmH [Bacillota bacterium]SDC50792.1 23S rRNA (pseudouridine1915-N3)-methyltransferase [Melghirimyces thermohalophilus]
MRIQLLAVGKMKERYLRMAVDDYVGRISPYAKVDVIEISEEKGQEPLNSAEREKIKEREGKRILRFLTSDTYTIALAIQGVGLSSESLAHQLDQLATYGKSRLAFVIGGSYGLSEEVMDRADFTLSFSKMTFPHQLMRVILLEQIYRSFKINRGETYHK